MAQFHYSLERVLRWRASELSLEEARLERLVREQLRLQSLWAALTAEKARLDASPGALPDLRGSDLRAIAAYRLHLRRQAEELLRRLADSDRELLEQKKKYRQAKQRFRLLEELKKRKLEEWRHLQDAQLEALAGETFLAGWNRDAR